MQNIIDHIIQSKAILSPLAGVSDLPFRLICRQFGCKFAFTEMVDASAVLYAKPDRFRMLDTTEDDRPLGVQLVDCDEQKLLTAALKCEDMGVFSVININMGCPVRKLTRKKKGVALMKDPLHVAKIVKTLVAHLSLPVVIKIRSGFDFQDRNAPEIAKIAQEEGAQAIFFHPRHGAQKYKGKIDPDQIKNVKENIKIPLIVSGDLFTADDVLCMLDNPYCDAVAVARGSFGQPWIFDEIEKKIAGQQPQEISLELKQKTIKQHFDLVCERLPMRVAIPKMYKHLTWYYKKHPLLGEYMKDFTKKIKTKEEFYGFVDGFYM